MYAITSKQSFKKVKDMFEEILRVKDCDKGEVPMLLVGNKVRGWLLVVVVFGLGLLSLLL